MNFVSGVTVTDKGPARGPGATAIETHLSGKIALPLHGKRGEARAWSHHSALGRCSREEAQPTN
jgi:hypothetical protein